MIFYEKEDVVVSYRARRRFSRAVIDNLTVQLISVKDESGQELLENPVTLRFSEASRSYEAVYRIPEGVSGVLTFTVKATGAITDIEKAQIKVEKI